MAQHVRFTTVASESGARLSDRAFRAVNAAHLGELRDAKGTIDLKQLESVRAPLTATIGVTRQTLSRIDDVSSPWLIPSLRHRVADYRTRLADTIPRAQDALKVIDVAPTLLGGKRPQRYLVLFGNPSESRGLGGFIGAWAQINADDGHLTLARHGHIDELNDAVPWQDRHISGPADYLARYSHLQPERFIQNVSASPDFPTVARVAKELYAESKGVNVDGVVYIDPIALGALLKVTGPVRPKGTLFRLNSQSVAPFLMHDQYLHFPGRTAARVDLLSGTAEATFVALTERKLPSIASFTSNLSPMTRQRRLMVWSDDPAAASYLHSVGVDGAFPKAHGHDLMSVRISNASTNKADYFLDQQTRYTVRFDPATGRTEAVARVTLTNRAPKHGEPAYVLGNPDTRAGKSNGRPFASDTVDLGIYSVLAPQALSLDGTHVGIQIQRELGMWVASRVVTVPAGKSITVEVTFSGRLDASDAYRLTVVPQAAARPRRTTVDVQIVDASGRPLGARVSRSLIDTDGTGSVSVPVPKTGRR